MTTKYANHYINIDSRDRCMKDIIEYNGVYRLENNSLSVKNKNLIIKQNNHNFSIGTKIKIDIQKVTKTLRSIVGRQPSFEIFEGTNIMKIICSHDFLNVQDVEVTIYDFANYDNKIGNIDIATINKKHILLTNIPGYESSAEWFYIKLPYTLREKYRVKENNFRLEFNYIASIPISFFDNVLTISSVSINEYLIKVNFSDVNSFGNNIIVNRVNTMVKSECINNYTVNLQQVYNNVVGIRIVSSIFLPQPYYINNNNNLLQWYNKGVLQTITIKEGFYRLDKLFNEINKQSSKYLINFIFTYDNILTFKAMSVYDDVKDNKITIEFTKTLIFNLKNTCGYKFIGTIEHDDYTLMKINDYNFLRYKNHSYFTKIDLVKNVAHKDKHFLTNPIPTIKELHISLYNSRGELYNFNTDHSFVLEIVTLDETLRDIGYYVSTHSNFNKENFNYLDPFF